MGEKQGQMNNSGEEMRNTPQSRRNNYNEQRVGSVSKDKKYAPKEYYIMGKLNNSPNEQNLRSASKDSRYSRNGGVINRSRSKSINDDENNTNTANRQASKSKERENSNEKRVKTELEKNKKLYKDELKRHEKFA